MDYYRSDRQLNQTNAYMRAYPNSESRKAANTNAGKLLDKTGCQDYLKAQAVKEDLGEDSVSVTVPRIIQELKRAALFNPKVLFDEDNRLKSMAELPDHVARAIGTIKTVKRVEHTPGEDKATVTYYTTEIKLISKEKTLELLGKHLVMFTEKFQIETEEAMHIRVRAEIVAQGEETLAMVLANTKRQLAIDRQGPVPDDRPKSPDKPIDQTDPEYLGRLF